MPSIEPLALLFFSYQYSRSFLTRARPPIIFHPGIHVVSSPISYENINLIYHSVKPTTVNLLATESTSTAKACSRHWPTITVTPQQQHTSDTRSLCNMPTSPPATKRYTT
jgi:hypothetical protein